MSATKQQHLKSSGGLLIVLALLRPSADEFGNFYEQMWAKVCEVWENYQRRLGVPKEETRELLGYFKSPFLRVKHTGGLEAYVKASAEARYGMLALAQGCYVAPTQAAFTPDGHQYRCGSHAVRRILPLGNIAERGVFDSIRAGISDLGKLPQEEHCYGCALATLFINQAVEAKLKKTMEAMLGAEESDPP